MREDAAGTPYAQSYFAAGGGGGAQHETILGRDGRVLQRGDQALCESDETLFRMHPNSQHRFDEAQRVGDTLERACVLALLALPNKQSSWMGLIDNNVHVPINFYVWRPYIKFEMLTCVLMQAGVETAANMLGPANMVFTNSGADKMMHAHFTFFHAPVVFKHEYIQLLRHVYPRQYLGGWDTTWINRVEDLYEGGGSLIATPIAVTETPHSVSLDLIDTSKPRLLPAVTNRARSQKDLPPYSSASMTERIYAISEEALMAATSFATASQNGHVVNVRSRAGKYFTRDPRSGYIQNKVAGSSALSGDRTGPGVAKVWKGIQRAVLPVQKDIEINLRIT